MKPTTKQIASKCGMSYGAVKKWPLARRERLAKMIEKGGCPQVADLLGEAQRLCYELSIKLGLHVSFSGYFEATGHFDVFYYDADVETRTSIASYLPLTVANLQTTIEKLEEMINA